MATIAFSAPVDSRQLIAEIDALTESDAISVTVDPATGLQTTTFDLSDGRTLAAEGPAGPEGAASRFVVSEGGEAVFTVEFVSGVDLAGGYALGDALADDAVGYFGSDPGATMVGYDQGDLFWGSAGTFIGAGGDDILWLRPDPVTAQDVAGRVIGHGGAGNDRLVIDGVTEALAIGGAGDDSLGLVSGETALSGGAGADVFVFEGGSGVASGGTGADTFSFAGGAEPGTLSVRIVDFDPAEDTLVFGFDDGALPDSVATAADLGAVTFDGVTWAVGETAGGDTWITRQGTSTAGTVYDDRILLDDVAAGEVALSLIVLDDGALI